MDRTRACLFAHEQGRSRMAGTNGAHESIQLFPALDLATEAALRASIERWGVLQPVVVDQDGRVLDGNHRARIADELGVIYETRTVEVGDEDDAHEVARTLNLDRRHLDAGDRRRMVGMLRQDGHSYPAIAGALGISVGTAHKDAQQPFNGERLEQPERIVGRDGKSRPSTRPATPAEVVDRAAWDEPALLDHLDELEANVSDAIEETEPERQVEAAEAAVEETFQHLANEAEAEERWDAEDHRPPVVKPDLGDGVSHPARFSRALIPIFARLLHDHAEGTDVLDPFAGPGGVHALREHGYVTTGIELEPEWATLHEHTQVGDATDLPFDAETFDAVVTSPAYGNRLADSYNSSDPHLRRSYRFDLGRELTDNNAGAMHWGKEYRALHETAWEEAWRVLRFGGVLILNIKDHLRDGALQLVPQWHCAQLGLQGFHWLESVSVTTPNLRQGANAELRAVEEVHVFRKV